MKSNLLHSTELGVANGPTLVFIPGLSGTTRYWLGRLGDLEMKYRIVLIDPLGFGDAPSPGSRYTIDSHVDALYQALKNEKQLYSLVIRWERCFRSLTLRVTLNRWKDLCY